MSLRKHIKVVAAATSLAALLLVASGSVSSARNAGPPPAPPGTTPLPPPGAHLGAEEPRPAKQRGVALGLFAEDIGFSYAALLREIADLGATHVALIVPIYQTHGGSHDLHLHTRFSPTLEQVADAIRAARRDKLDVTLFPIVRLSAPRSPAEWRGTLAPEKPDAWFAAYGSLMGDLAGIASLTGATRFVVGSELSSLDGDLGRWRPLVERIRGLFAGTLVYSANWDHYREARLFELVDEEGVVAYFPLRSADGPSAVTDLERGWRRLSADIAMWHRGRNKPFVFTEVGYRSRAGSSASPWDEGPGGRPDPDEQRRAFAAFSRVWSGDPTLAGVYIWNWYGFGGPDSVSYTPRGKPALFEVKRLLEDL